MMVGYQNDIIALMYLLWQHKGADCISVNIDIGFTGVYLDYVT